MLPDNLEELHGGWPAGIHHGSSGATSRARGKRQQLPRKPALALGRPLSTRGIVPGRKPIASGTHPYIAFLI